MNRRHRHMLLAAVAMLAAGPAALALRPGRVPPETPPAELEVVLPLAFGEWRVDQRLAQIASQGGEAGSSNRTAVRTINRMYTSVQGGSVTLTVSYGGDENDALKGRRLEESLAAQGFQVSNVMRDRLHLEGWSIPVTRLTTIRGAHTQPITYWITVGDRIVRNRGEWLSAQLLQGLAGHSVEGLQFSISTPAEDDPGAFAEHDRFIATLLAEMPAAGLARLLGSRPS